MNNGSTVKPVCQPPQCKCYCYCYCYCGSISRESHTRHDLATQGGKGR
jgi:hypothetical protein